MEKEVKSKKSEIVEDAYQKAVQVLDLCKTKKGFFAAYPGYDAVWSRDSMITSLGASLHGENYKETFKQSLITLAENQSPLGQIPNAVDKFSKKRESHVDYKSIDSTLWFIIGHYIYKKRFNDSLMERKYTSELKKALTWLSYQDMGVDGMLEQLPTTDWFDAFPHRYGHTINTQALYYYVLKITGQYALAQKLKVSVNEDKDNALWDSTKGYYLPWRWKNHGDYHEKGEWFDSLGNFLAILFDLADENQAKKILFYVQQAKIDHPYPVKCIYPPIKRGSKDWQDYFNDCSARNPYHYSNAGIWTYIGGFYILCLIATNSIKEAEIQLKKLAEANMKSNFGEWLNGKTGISGESYSGSQEGNQAWNAGMYVLAYESLLKGKVLL